MLGAEDEERQANGRKPYLRSVSWSDRSPNKPNLPYPRAQPSSKTRSCLPPLQPLSISRRNVEEWPKAGSDDLGVWPQPTTPGGRIGCGLGSKPSGIPKLEVPKREFESNKDRLAFYEKECSRIVDHIYLGSELVAKNREVLRQNGITHVLNCVGFVCREYFKNELVYKTLWLQDSPSEDITSILYDVFDYFEEVREQGGRVLVHCSQGVSRSTSLVIAYLMWREGQSFDDAFQFVKAARGVTNPNMGFACQLLQCQKRVHAVPLSPNSVLRMYRMAPHSPYDPLHLVPKLLSHPGEQALDSRGSFVVHVPSAIYVWVGKFCSSVMSNNAKVAAQQVMKYEGAQGPILTIKEGEEPSEFWDALSRREHVKDDTEMIDLIQDQPMDDKACIVGNTYRGHRKVDDYNLDFEIFHKALSGGVVPPFMLSGSESETCLPARENGWSKLRRKFAKGIMKEFLSSPKVDCHNNPFRSESEQMRSSEAETCPPARESGWSKLRRKFAKGIMKEFLSSPKVECHSNPFCCESEPIQTSPDVMEEPVSPTAYLLQSIPRSTLSRDSIPENSSFCEGFELYVRRSDSSCPSPSPCSSPDSFVAYQDNRPTCNSKSPSLSPSTSDYSNPFTFSPSSSNWSDLSNLSSQPSPSGLEFTDRLCTKNPTLIENDSLLQKETARPCLESFSCVNGWKSTSLCSCKGTSPSIAERRGSNLPTLILQSPEEPVCAPKTLVRSWSFSLPDVGEEFIDTEID